MENDATSQRVPSARLACDGKGKGLTVKRQRVLELLLHAKKPLSAYELTDAYNARYAPPIKAMSVYRILDYLTSVHLTHRLHSANKYMACTNRRKCDGHALSLFLMCSVCEKVEESAVTGELNHLITKSSNDAGFHIYGSQLEMSGICSECQSKKTEKVKGKKFDEPTTD